MKTAASYAIALGASVALALPAALPLLSISLPGGPAPAPNRPFPLPPSDAYPEAKRDSHCPFASQLSKPYWANASTCVCPATAFIDTKTGYCRVCPAPTIWGSNDKTTCQCGDGYTWNPSTNTCDCPAPKLVVNSVCEAPVTCKGSNVKVVNNRCVCNDGYGRDVGGVCLQCPWPYESVNGMCPCESRGPSTSSDVWALGNSGLCEKCIAFEDGSSGDPTKCTETDPATASQT